MNAHNLTSTHVLEASDTVVLDAPAGYAHPPSIAFTRGRLSLATAACAVFCACSPAGAAARGAESARDARSAPASAEARPEAPSDEAAAPAGDVTRAPSEPSGAEPATSHEPRPLPELLEEARRDVLALGRADVSNIKERSAQVLTALAALVQARDRDREAKAQLAELDFEAERLRRASGASFAQSGWVRLGLVAALDALQQVAPAQQRMQEQLRGAARQAAEAIPERSSLAFHHAAIQDAARATVDAYALSLPEATSCLCPDDGALESAAQTAAPRP